MTSNLSKIKTKFRTSGQVTGNFGKSKVRTNGNSEIGLTKVDNINITTPDEYLNKMINAYHTTKDDRLKEFCYNEVKRILVQRGEW